MSKREIITGLSAEQESQFPTYREKWRSIASSTKPIDRDKVAEVINAAYLASNYSQPETLFYSNPLKAIQEVAQIKDFQTYLGRDISTKFSKRVLDHLLYSFRQQMDDRLAIRLRNQTLYTQPPYYSTASNPLVSYFPSSMRRCIELQLITDIEKLNPDIDFSSTSYLIQSLNRPAEWAALGCEFDFCIAILKLHHDKKKWQIVQQLIQECGFLFRFENVCLACDRPSKILFDEENFLHAEGKPALQFADGYGVYANHGKSPFEY